MWVGNDVLKKGDMVVMTGVSQDEVEDESICG